jgi:uncharacterized protein HemY
MDAPASSQAESSPPSSQAASAIPSSERDVLLTKAQRLEGKKLFVKAAEVYKKINMNDKAAGALEQGGAYEEAAKLFDELGRKEDAARCRKSLEDAKNPRTWSDLQADFQQDYPG